MRSMSVLETLQEGPGTCMKLLLLRAFLPLACKQSAPHSRLCYAIQLLAFPCMQTLAEQPICSSLAIANSPNVLVQLHKLLEGQLAACNAKPKVHTGTLAAHHA